MHGCGKFYFQDGRKYEGEYVEDKKHGRGVYYWSDGRRYDGEWRLGYQHGKGIMFFPDGTYKIGMWDHGQRLRWLEEEQNVNSLRNSNRPS